jgi:hypothetical protein
MGTWVLVVGQNSQGRGLLLYAFIAWRGTTFSHIQTILVDIVMQHMMTA